MGKQHGTFAATPATRVRLDDGFTVIELSVVMVIFGLLAALGSGGWLRYQRSAEHRGSAQELVSTLRQAQQASLAEAVTYCVSFNLSARSFETLKFTCGAGGISAGPPRTTQAGRVSLAAANFTQLDASISSEVSFFPRGSATKGSVVVAREGSDKTYTITVEGLTGRVSLDG